MNTHIRVGVYVQYGQVQTSSQLFEGDSKSPWQILADKKYSSELALTVSEFAESCFLRP